jgi:hypothetical protein
MSGSQDLDRLERAVGGAAAAFRCVTRYEPGTILYPHAGRERGSTGDRGE